MRRRIAARMAVEDENSQPRQSVTVRVPASSANCGPGYDCIGLAVDLWTEVTVSRSDKLEITAEGDGAAEMPKDESNLLVTGVKAAYETAKKPMPPLKYHVVSRIPYARGLGSSSAAIVAGIIAGLVLAGHRLPVWGSESLLQIAATIEGHPDNVAPVSLVGVSVIMGVYLRVLVCNSFIYKKMLTSYVHFFIYLLGMLQNTCGISIMDYKSNLYHQLINNYRYSLQCI